MSRARGGRLQRRDGLGTHLPPRAPLYGAHGPLCASPGGPRRRLIEFVTDRPGHDLRYAIDSSKLQAELGWRPTVTFAEGLARTVDWYLANEAWWGAIQDGTHAGSRLGLS